MNWAALTCDSCAEIRSSAPVVVPLVLIILALLLVPIVYFLYQRDHNGELPKEWEKVPKEESESGKVQYKNRDTQEISYTRPRELPKGWEQKENDSGEVYYVHWDLWALPHHIVHVRCRCAPCVSLDVQTQVRRARRGDCMLVQ